MFEYAALCTAVHDGDTFTLNVDLGFDTWHVGSFRLAGCNARELTQPGGIEARDYLSGVLLDARLVIRSVRPDKFGGRYDAYVRTVAGVDLTELLVDEGWAAAWNGRGSAPLPPWPRT